MALTNTPVFPQIANRGLQRYVQGTDSAGVYKTLYTVGANGASKVVAVNAANADTVAHNMFLVIANAATVYLIGVTNVVANAGNDGITPSINLLAGGPNNLITGLPVDSDGQRYLFLTTGDTLQATFTGTLSASAIIYVTTFAADF